MNVRLDDLASPRFSAEGQQILDMMATMAPECPLDAGALHAKASADTGLHDFGPNDYRERLEVYLAALREIDGLHAAGVVNFFGQLLQVLKNRLLLTDLLSRHPEINAIELRSPVVIAGLPAPAPRTCITCWPRRRPFAPCRTGKATSRSRCRMRLALNRTRGEPGWMSRSG